MKVTQTETRHQRKSYAKYKQTLGKADPIIVRRAVSFPNVVTHPSSTATKVQRQRLARASQAASSALGSDKDAIRQATRLSLTGSGSQPGQAKILTGRQAFISQAIRDQQLGETVANFRYPCFKITDRLDRPFHFTHARFNYFEPPVIRPTGIQLLEEDWIFIPFDVEYQVKNLSFRPWNGLADIREYGVANRAMLDWHTYQLNPAIMLYFWGYNLPRTEWRAYYPESVAIPSTYKNGIRFLGNTCRDSANPKIKYWCLVDFDIEYISATHWTYHFNQFDHQLTDPEQQGIGTYLCTGFPTSTTRRIKPFTPFNLTVDISLITNWPPA